MKLAILVALSHTVTVAFAQSVFYADGGYTATKTPCFEGWVFKNKKGTNDFETLTPSATCVSFDELEPNMEAGPLLEPTDPNTSRLKWCSTRDIYNPKANVEENTKEWGYCLEETSVEATSSPTTGGDTSAPTSSETSAPTSNGDNQGEDTSAPTTSETSTPTTNDEDDGIEYFADGGFMDEPTPCFSGWTWKDKDGTNDFNLVTPSGTCIPFTELQPANDPNLGEIMSPTDVNTDQLSWCSTIDIYNPVSKNEDNLRSWGFCLTRSSQATGSPTESEATPEPTPLQTSSPTSSEGTSSPTIPEGTSSPTIPEGTSSPTIPEGTSSPTAPTSNDGAGPDGNQPGTGDTINAAAVAVPIVLIILIAAIVVGAVCYKKRKNNEEALPTTKSDDDGAGGPQDMSDKKSYSPIKIFNQAANKSAASLRNLTQSFTSNNSQSEPMSEPLVQPLETEQPTKVEVQGGVAPTQPEPAATAEGAQAQPGSTATPTATTTS